MPEGSPDDMTAIRSVFIGRFGSVLMVKGVATSFVPALCASAMHIRIQRIAAADIQALHRAIRAHVRAFFNYATAVATVSAAEIKTGWP